MKIPFLCISLELTCNQKWYILLMFLEIINPWRIGMPTVLIVDDDEVNLRAVSTLVKVCMTHIHPGMVIVHAGHGADAWEKITDPGSDVSIVISDVHMPVMTGTELANIIREKHPDIGVILISGAAEPAGHSADAFLTKPLTMERMMNTIRRLMARKA